MIKLIRTADTNWDEAVASLIKVGRHGGEWQGFEKRAGAVLRKEFEALEPSEKYAWVHTLAIGSTAHYGPNRNGDGFSESELIKAHPTFMKHAHLYENHANKDPAKAIGIVKFSAYNPEMHRVELIIGLDKSKAPQHIEKLAKGEDLGGSMGCRVAHDVCSICGHKAPSPASYCFHAKNAMCQILEDGRQVYVDNPDPHFFDWSVVRRPADRVAFAFHSKVASAQSWVSSVTLAKEAGLWLPEDSSERRAQKLAVLRKLSEMEKEISTKLSPVDKSIAAATPEEALEDGDAQKLRGQDLEAVLENMHTAQVVLPIRDFLKLVANKKHGDLDDVASDVQGRLPGVFTRLLDDDAEGACSNSCFDGGGTPGGPLGDLIGGLVPQLGMGMGPLGKRVTITVIRAHPKTAVHRVSNDPDVETLAKLYAVYKLAAVSHPRNLNDGVLTRAAVLQNYSHLI